MWKMSYRTRETLIMEDAAESIGTHAVYPWSKRLQNKFTTDVFFSDEPVQLYKRLGDKILLPRGVCHGGIDETVLGEEISFPNNIVPRDYQVPILEEAEELLLKEKPDNFIIQAGTGTGKTAMGLYLIAKVGRPALVIVHRDFLMMDIWAKSAEEMLGLHKDEIGFIQGDKCDYEGKKLVIGMVQSISKEARYPEEMYNYFGQIWFDECERMSAELFSQAVSMFPAKVRVGLSATPYRKDGRGVVFESHIGPVKIRYAAVPKTPKVIIVKSNWEVPTVLWYGRYQPLPHEYGKVMHVNRKLVADPDRNKLLFDLISKCYSKDRNLIVFSDLARDKHLNRLKSELMNAPYFIPEDQIGFLVGGMSKAARYKSARCKVILCTYSYAGAGVDIPWADTCILFTPRSDVTQFIGRITREYPDKKDSVVFDIQDNDSHVFRSYAGARIKQYNELGAEIKYYG